MEKQHDFKILSGFVIKIMAIVFMTFDHIGLFMGKYENLQEISQIFRILGRLSFPLFIFLLVEGIRYTKNISKYFTRLSLLAIAFFIGQMFYYFVISKNSAMLSPVIDLLLTASCVYLLKRKDKYSFLAILPILWAGLCMFARNYEMTHFTQVKWVPFFLRPDYSIYGPLLGVGFYYANELATLYFNSREDTKIFIDTTYERTAINLISVVVIVVVTVGWTFIDQHAFKALFSIPWQIYALFSFIPILFYSGKRGYNAKWFQYGCYFYFPMHLIIIFGIFALL